MSDSATTRAFASRADAPNADVTRPFDPEEALKTFLAPSTNQSSRWSNTDSVEFKELDKLVSRQYHKEPEKAKLRSKALNSWLFDKLSSGQIRNAPADTIRQIAELIEFSLAFELDDPLRMILFLRLAQVRGCLPQYRDEAAKAADIALLIAASLEDPRNLLVANLIRSQVGPNDSMQRRALEDAVALSRKLSKKANDETQLLQLATLWRAYEVAKKGGLTRKAKRLKKRLDRQSVGKDNAALTALRNTPPLLEAFSS